MSTKTYTIPSVSPYIFSESFFESQLFILADGVSSGHKELQKYFTDLTALFLEKLNAYTSASAPTDIDKQRLSELFQEIIHVKKILKEESVK